MKTDYEKIIDFCEAEIENPQSEFFNVVDRGTHYVISLPLPESAITIYKPIRASIFDKNRVSFGEGWQAPYSELPIWSHIANMLGLKSAWVACADRLPENGTWICSDGVDSFEARIRNGIAFVHDGCYQKVRTYTHWQPLPAQP